MPERCPECQQLGGHLTGCSVALPPLPTADGPRRHGCFTAFLVLMFISNGINAVVTPFSLKLLQTYTPSVTPVYLVLLTACSLLNLVFAFALLRWRRWGFYGFVVMSLVALGINLSLGLGARALPGLAGILILYGVMQIGGPDSAWSRMK